MDLYFASLICCWRSEVRRSLLPHFFTFLDTAYCPPSPHPPPSPPFLPPPPLPPPPPPPPPHLPNTLDNGLQFSSEIRNCPTKSSFIMMGSGEKETHKTSCYRGMAIPDKSQHMIWKKGKLTLFHRCFMVITDGDLHLSFYSLKCLFAVMWLSWNLPKRSSQRKWQTYGKTR